MGMNKKLKQSLNIGKIEQYSDEVIVDTYDFVFDKDGDIVTIYNECDDDERREFVDYVVKCWNEERDIDTYDVMNEGVRDDSSEEYFAWCERHTRWYKRQ